MDEMLSCDDTHDTSCVDELLRGCLVPSTIHSNCSFTRVFVAAVSDWVL